MRGPSRQQQAGPASLAGRRPARGLSQAQEAPPWPRYRRRCQEPHRPNALWALDFQFDTTEDNRTIKLLDYDKLLNFIDEFTRECPAIVVERSIDADRVVATLDRLVVGRGAPSFVRFDNGPEFIAHAVATGVASTMSAPPSSIRTHPGRTPGSSPSTDDCATSCSTHGASTACSKPRCS